MEEEGRSGTQLYNIAVLNSIERFSGENITFSSITVDWLKRYEKHMLKEGKSYTTVGMYMRALRAIVNEAKKNGVIKENQYPFGKDKYEIPTGEGRKLALTLPQIKQIISYTDVNPTTERYRDLWFFSYLCNGINFSDLLKLKYSDIEGKEISFYRSKTIRTSKVKREIRAIILDVTKRTNKRLKTIGSAVGIEGLTTYVARHSYATVLKRSGANIAFISESLGHNDLKTTENYLDSFEIEERMKNASLLTQGFYD